MRRRALVAVGAAVALAAGVQAGATGSEGKDVLEFDVMSAVDGPFVGAAHPVRGVAGGGLPWELDRARGRLTTTGRLDVRVDGLVLARRAPVPANLQGTNPIPQFRAAVNCLTPDAPEQGRTILTDPVPASPAGDARIRTAVELPASCVAPVVFVTSPTGAWFAATGR
jgi:hypothetical protein